MRPLLCFLLLTAFAINSRAQIQLQNPSMEGPSCWGPCDPPLRWNYCETLLWIVDTSSTFWPQKVPHIAYDSVAYVVLENQASVSDFGSISQELNCELKTGVTYNMSLACASWFEPSVFDSLYKGHLNIYLGDDSCDKEELVWTSSSLDSVWKRFSVTFKPVANHKWFIFWPTRDSSIADIAVDALSPIYLVNANEAYITNSDTTLSLGECIYAQAQSANTTYDSLYWINTHTGTSFANGQWNTLLCPDSSTTYLLAMRDSVPDCAGYKWSYDTLRITVLNTTTGINSSAQNRTSFAIYPNPAKDVVMLKYSSNVGEGLLLQVYNALGQVVYRDRATAAQQINVSTWTAGVYSFIVLQNGAAVSTMRFLKE